MIKNQKNVIFPKTYLVVLFLFIFFSCTTDFNINQNNLGLETSAYLKQHDQNPIHWQRWDNDLYKKWNKKQKLLIVSIGYSSCHWCHVMEKETFKDSVVSNYMNKHFINIKVDREENPEIDNIYLTATQMMTGKGGWPLNVVCLPNGKPIYGGTYHTKEQWVDILNKIQNVYENDKTKLVKLADQIMSGIQEINHFEYDEDPPVITPETLHNEMKIWSGRWDSIHGGEKTAQKFISPVKFNYIQQYQYLNNDNKIKNYFEKTLQNIANSGIVDHLEGGFYRYSIDSEWKIPHFEKMLYDNALLLDLYANAYKESKNPLFKSTVYQIYDFLQKRMNNNKGTYFSAIDADNNQGEGRYYIFDREEIVMVGNNDISLLKEFYRINFDNPFKNRFFHLRKISETNGLANKYGISISQLKIKILAWEKQFESIKKQREFPLVDDKIITSWNALAISGLVSAYEAFGDDVFLNKAEEAFLFIQNNLFQKGKLMHTFQANEAKLEGNLEDYAFTVKASLSLYQNTGKTQYLEQAHKLTISAIKHFKDNDNPYFTLTENPVMFSDIITLSDSTLPSANAIMAESLWILGQLIENEQFKAMAESMLNGISSYFSDGKSSDYTQWAQLILKETLSFKEIIIVGPQAKEVNKKIKQHYLPNTLFQISEIETDLPLLKDRFFDDETLIYVCENKVCMRPTKNFEEAINQIKGLKNAEDNVIQADFPFNYEY